MVITQSGAHNETAAVSQGALKPSVRTFAPSSYTRRATPLSRWPVPRSDEFLVIAVGGLGRIGMNWTLYGNNGRWLLVDAGLAFPDDRSTGVDAIIPDVRSLEPILHRLDGLVVTHAHEDHIGAIDRLWPKTISCPIYATPFAAELISRRLEEAKVLDDADLRVFQVGTTFSVGDFEVRSISVTHSVPEPVALAITTPAGTILHTGDFKFDPDPTMGPGVDIDGLQDVGDRGLLALVADSTNALSELPITSEKQVREAFRRIFERSKGAVVICCFASNVARMASAAVAAQTTGRKVALAGRSMRNNQAIAEDMGMLDALPPFLAEPRHLQGLDRREMALVCTGGQGEERAALARLARGDYRLPKLERGDTVVMSTRVIPGNEAEVEKIISKLRSSGIEVIEAGTMIDGVHPVHVSGHAGRHELRGMHALTRPRFVLPVHGDEERLQAHALIALESGAEAAPVAEPGDVLSISERGVKRLGWVAVPTMDLENDEQGNRMPVSAHYLRRFSRHSTPEPTAMARMS
jgi:ribonuclease J